TVSIDPRTLKSLIQAQLAPSLSFGAAAKKPVSQDEPSLFDSILSSRLGSGDAGEPQGSGMPPVWTDQLWAQLASFDVAGGNGTLADVSAQSSGHNFSEESAPFT